MYEATSFVCVPHVTDPNDLRAWAVAQRDDRTAQDTGPMSDIAAFFWGRAAGLAGSAEEEELFAAGRFPVAVRSFAKIAGRVLVPHPEHRNPCWAPHERAPASVSMWRVGDPHTGEGDSRYQWVSTAALPVGAVVYRVSCHGTLHVFAVREDQVCYWRVEADEDVAPPRAWGRAHGGVVCYYGDEAAVVEAVPA